MTFLRRNKYRNRPTAGYASRKEANRAWELRQLEKAGEITELNEQPRFELLPAQPGERAIHYRADFSYRDKDGREIVEDVKGIRTREYVLKRKLFLAKYGFAITEV